MLQGDVLHHNWPEMPSYPLSRGWFTHTSIHLSFTLNLWALFGPPNQSQLSSWYDGFWWKASYMIRAKNWGCQGSFTVTVYLNYLWVSLRFTQTLIKLWFKYSNPCYPFNFWTEKDSGRLTPHLKQDLEVWHEDHNFERVSIQSNLRDPVKNRPPW